MQGNTAQKTNGLKQYDALEEEEEERKQKGKKHHRIRKKKGKVGGKVGNPSSQGDSSGAGRTMTMQAYGVAIELTEGSKPP